MLDELRLDYESLQVLGTPRRLVLVVENLAPTQRDLEQVVKGPPAERAFDSDGAPTKAAQGFARSKGVQVGDLEVRKIDGGRYVTAVVRESGRPAVEVLAEALPDLIARLRFEQSMRWNSTNVAFSRPIRWLLTLYGDQVVPFAYAGLESGQVTRGLRFNDPAEFPIDNTRDYMEQMQAQGILLDFEERRANIRAQVETLAAQVGGIIPEDPGLLDEVTNLVEAPAALLGSFDPEHLALPREVLISVMKKHQRYFPVQQKDRLLPYFITVANKPSLGPNKCEGAETIIDGNEHVVRARFTDAAYFVRQDLKSPLADYLPRLDTLSFQTKLGSMLDKTGRIRKLVEDLIPMIDLDESQAKVARRAAELCKADLVTSMVIEMTSLQGVMGSHYALTSGEPEPVALAIYDHYLPRFAGDQTAQTRPGLVIGLADRLDTLTGLFAAGLAPTGNKDPFAQRRAALGLVQNLLTWDLNFDLDAAIAMAAIHQPIEADENVESEVTKFIIERLRNILLDDGWRYDIVDAILNAQGSNPAAALRAVRELNSWVERSEWDEILPAYARCVRITRDLGTVYDLDPNGFTETASQDLYAALIGAERAERVPGSVDNFLNAFTPMIPAINRFFDKVLVMAEEKSVRHNRLALLQRIAALAQSVADMSRLEGF
jgi:glycyl-tRNA synthetase